MESETEAEAAGGDQGRAGCTDGRSLWSTAKAFKLKGGSANNATKSRPPQRQSSVVAAQQDTSAGKGKPMSELFAIDHSKDDLQCRAHNATAHDMTSEDLAICIADGHVQVVTSHTKSSSQ